MITPRSAPTARLSDEALVRLPPLFAEIVKHQREVDDFVSQPVVDLRLGTNMIDRQRYLARHAHRTYRAGDGTIGCA